MGRLLVDLVRLILIKEHSFNLLERDVQCEVGGINFHLNKLSKAKFSTLCDVIFLVRLQGKFEIDHSWE